LTGEKQFKRKHEKHYGSCTGKKPGSWMKQDGVMHANQKTREETENEVQQKRKNNRIQKGEGSGE
jgi:hypothetical protein